MKHAVSLCREFAATLPKSAWTPAFPLGLRSKNSRYASTAVSSRPLRVGIIGSGPAGFYAALRILQKLDDARVDMYEQLPSPFGLVRYGVAPDHPEVKNCQERFHEVAQSPRFTFLGNVEVGKDVPLSTLKHNYDALLFAYGAAKDRVLGIPGEHLQGVISARAFVGWYNGLPEYENLRPDLTTTDTAVVIGNGNVALDIARILLSETDTLRKTDISGHALDALSRSSVKKVLVCGRRGPMQAVFTIKEVRELLNMSAVSFQPVDEHLLPTAEHVSALPRLEQRKYRLANLIAKGSKTRWSTCEKSWSLMSLLSPSIFEEQDASQILSGVTFTKNEYLNDDERFDHNARIQPTKDSLSVATKLAFRSIGYKSIPLDGLQTELNMAFDEKQGVIPNDGNGRAFAAFRDDLADHSKHAPGCYCAGWVKRGPTGVIASTMEDAFASADVLINDWIAGVQFLDSGSQARVQSQKAGWEGVLHELGSQDKRPLRSVSWEDWRRIDAAEVERGRKVDRPREKFRTQAEMLQVLD